MKAKSILLFTVLTITTQAFSQFRDDARNRVYLRGFEFLKGASPSNALNAHCGIYKSPDDRRAGRLSVAIRCESEEHRIKPGFVKEKSAVKLVRNDQTFTFLKEDLYGYRDCRGKEYHFFEGKSYEVLNPGEAMPIYRTFEQTGKRRMPRYFFTTHGSAELMPLTMDNLTEKFSDEPLFLEKLRMLAENDNQLVKYIHIINRVRSHSDGI